MFLRLMFHRLSIGLLVGFLLTPILLTSGLIMHGQPVWAQTGDNSLQEIGPSPAEAEKTLREIGPSPAEMDVAQQQTNNFKSSNLSNKSTHKSGQPVAKAGSVQSGPSPSSIELYDHGVELFEIAQIQAEKGNLKGQEDLLKQAILNFEQSLKLNSKFVDAQSNIGFAYLTLKKYKKAIQSFQKALEMNPNHLNTLNGLATTYALDNRTDEALGTFDKLTTLDPTNPQYFFNKGSVLQKARRFSEAKRAYLEALRLNPKDQRSLFNLGTLLENQGMYTQALEYYRQAKEVDISSSVGLEAVRRIESLQTAIRDRSPETAPRPAYH